VKTSFVVLSQGEQMLILRGFVHYFSPEIGVKLSQELKDYQSQGFQHFTESIKRVPVDRNMSRNGRKVRLYIRLRNSILRIMSQKESLPTIHQLSLIQKSRHKIFADIDINMYARAVDAAGIEIPDESLRKLLRLRSSTTQIALAAEIVEKMRNNGITWWEEKKRSDNITPSSLVREMEAIICPLREAHAANIVNEWMSSNQKNAILDYGEAHIPGLTALFLEKGWHLVSREIREL